MSAKPDPHRPIYHYTPEPAECSSLASADGLIYWKGSYHVFYQHNRGGTLHNAPMEWGHAVSPDMIHWKELPTALSPTPGGPDEAGCFSGCAVDNDGVPTIVYTGVTRLDPTIDFEWKGREFRGFWANHTQCLAVGSDDLVEWVKHPGNPVLSKGLETGLGGDLVPHWHDPCVWREDHTWYMLLGSGVEDSGAVHLLYRSTNLIDWLFDRRLFGIADDHHSSCPDIFTLADSKVLLEARGNRYFVGSYSGHSYTVSTSGSTDFGIGSTNAPKTFVDERGRRVMMAGVLESRSLDAQRNSGWSGVLSLPRLTSIRIDGRLGMTPLPELSTLRRGGRSLGPSVISSDSPTLFDLGGDSIEIEALIDMRNASWFGLSVLCTPDREEETLIAYDRTLDRLLIDRHRSSLNPDLVVKEQGGQLHLAKGEKLELRIYIDRSIIEVFANSRAAITTRIYPTRRDAKSIGASVRGGQATIESLSVWEMGSILATD